MTWAKTARKGAAGAAFPKECRAGPSQLHDLAVSEGLTDFFALCIRSSDETVFSQRGVRTDHVVAREELDIFLQARDNAEVSLLDVEEQRAGNRVLARSDRFRSTERYR
jgi:hypothetical protein